MVEGLEKDSSFCFSLLVAAELCTLWIVKFHYSRVNVRMCIVQGVMVVMGQKDSYAGDEASAKRG